MRHRVSTRARPWGLARLNQRWVRKRIEEADPDFHPKTINGCVWKLVEEFPDQVYKPEKGLLRLTKFRSS